MFRIRRPEGLRLSRREAVKLMLYTVTIAAASVLAHEAAHIVAAVALGVPLGELQSGFLGINPAVTLPEWFTGTPRTIVRYAGGLSAGAALLLFYLLHWARRYRHRPSSFSWLLGAITMVFAAVQFATGYLEGRYYGAYITGAMSAFSVTDILIYGWAVSAVFFHSAVCPLRRMRATGTPMTDMQRKSVALRAPNENTQGDSR